MLGHNFTIIELNKFVRGELKSIHCSKQVVTGSKQVGYRNPGKQIRFRVVLLSTLYKVRYARIPSNKR